MECTACVEGYFNPVHGDGCFECESRCESCTGETNEECDTCNEGYFLSMSTCDDVCPERQFGNHKSATCDDCSSSCSDCDSLEVCNECDAYYQLSDDVCVECSADCVYCEGDRCTECDEGMFIDFTGLCVADCGDGNFADVETGSCVVCHEACTLCYGADISECTECADGHFTDYP
jgi:proprotein convertase subtilisin/kexin type 5